MKGSYFTLILMVLVSCKQQKSEMDHYEINGIIKNTPNNTYVYLNNMGSVDSTITSNGKFRFEGKVKSPTRVLLSVENLPNKRSFWLENERIEISGTYGNIDELNVLGGENQEIANKLSNRTKPIILQKKKLSDLITSNRENPINKDSLYALNKTLSLQLAQLEKEFLKKHRNTLEGVLLLNKYKKSWKKDSVIEVFASMKPEIQKTKYGVSIKRYLELSKNPQVGELYIDFENKAISGDKVNLSQLRAKYTLVDFWASWCAPCRKENPNLVKLFNKYSEKGFNIIGISMDRDRDRWLRAIAEDNLPWDNLNDFKGSDSEAPIIYDVREIPDNFLLDENGKIIARNLRSKNLEKKLQQLLGF